MHVHSKSGSQTSQIQWEENPMINVISKQTAEHDLNLAQYGKAIAIAEMKQHTTLQAQFEASRVSYNKCKHGEIFPEILALTKMKLL